MGQVLLSALPLWAKQVASLKSKSWHFLSISLALLKNYLLQSHFMYLGDAMVTQDRSQGDMKCLAVAYGHIFTLSFFPFNRAGMVLSRDDIRFLGKCICNAPAPSLSLPSSWSLLTHPVSTASKKSHQTGSHKAWNSSALLFPRPSLFCVTSAWLSKTDWH